MAKGREKDRLRQDPLASSARERGLDLGNARHPVDGGEDGHPQPAEHDRPRLAAGGGVLLAENGVAALEIDELARFAVPPVEEAEAGADVGLDRGRLSERHDAHRKGHRHDAQPQLLLDLGAVPIREPLVDRRDRAPAAGNRDSLQGAGEPLGRDALRGLTLQTGGDGEGQLPGAAHATASAGEAACGATRDCHRQNRLCHLGGRVALHTERRVDDLEAREPDSGGD